MVRLQCNRTRRRYTIYLSSRTYRCKTVEGFKDLVETLVYYRKNGTLVPERAVANRLAEIPAELQTKLANAGLIHVTKSRTCQELWDTFMKHKTGIKPKSLGMYRSIQKAFFETFSPNELVEKMTAERLLDWKVALLTQYAVATVAGHEKVAKMVFEWGGRSGLVDEKSDEEDSER
jgi:hypothetical protein